MKVAFFILLTFSVSALARERKVDKDIPVIGIGGKGDSSCELVRVCMNKEYIQTRQAEEDEKRQNTQWVETVEETDKILEY